MADGQAATEPANDAAAENVEIDDIDRDSLNILPLAIVPLSTRGLQKSRMIKNARLNTVIEIFADDSSGSLQLEIDGELRQQGGYELMMYKPAQILEGISEFMSLDDGDIIMTGTPKGVGQVQPGERFVGRVLSGERMLVECSWTAE